MDIKKYIGLKIREARKEIGVSQKKLGQAVGYATSTISQLESGQFRASLESLEKVADFLVKPLSFFLPEKRKYDYSLPTKLISLEKQLLEIKKFLQIKSTRAKFGFFYVVVSGNIGVGKRLAVKQLANYFNGKAFLENYSGNPYLKKFYQNMKSWAFKSQLYFFSASLKQHFLITRNATPSFQGRSIYEQFEIFAKVLYQQGFLAGDDFEMLKNLYETVEGFVQAPDLVIYLKKKPELVFQDLKKSALLEEERNIKISYLSHLDQAYNAWFQNFSLTPKMVIDVEGLDFSKDEDFEVLIRKIKDAL